MRIRIFRMLAGLTAAASLAAGQTPKSPKEREAVLAVMQATTPDATISAVDNLVTKFGDTEFKTWALERAAESEQKKGDLPKALVYAERAAEDPNSFYGIQAMLMISGELARTTREFDLDKEEKLGRSEKLAKQSMDNIGSAAKPGAQVTDEQWAAVKKDIVAEAHKDLGLTAMARKKYDAAITEFKAAVEGASTPDPTDMVRLASAYDQAGQFDAAAPLLDKVINAPGMNPAIKNFALAEKKRNEEGKNGKK